MFKLLPAYKYQIEVTNEIYSTNFVKVIAGQSSKKNIYLHVSQEIESYKSLRKAVAEEHREMKKKQVNASLEDSVIWRVLVYNSFADSQKHLCCGDSVWLRHLESSSYLTCSQTTRLSTDFFSVAFLLDSASSDRLVGNTFALWVVENADCQSGGIVKTSQKLRLRHVNTGCYLACVNNYDLSNSNDKPFMLKLLPFQRNLKPDQQRKFDLETFFEFALDSGEEKVPILKNSAVYLRQSQLQKYVDVEPNQHRLIKKKQDDSEFCCQLLPDIKNAFSEEQSIKLVHANHASVWETAFLVSAQPKLLKLADYFQQCSVSSILVL